MSVSDVVVNVDIEQSIAACKWIAFDAVGTLIDPNPTVAVAYHSIGVRFGSRLTVGEIGHRFRVAFRRSEDDGFPDGPPATGRWKTSDLVERARWKWIVREVLTDVQDQDGCFEVLWDHFSRPSSWSLYDDVAAALSQIAGAGYRLAIASNFDGRLNSICDAIPCLAAVELRIISSRVGFRKPSGEFFDSVARACGCEPSQILMIGDNHEYDVAAPRRAGLNALHLNRSLSTGKGDQLASLSELADWVDK